jgi:twinkle protein
MRGVCVEKLPHRTDKCNSADALQVFQKEDGSHDGFCFACGTYVPDPYKDKPKGYKPVAIRKSKEEVEKELKEIEDFVAVDLPERKLRKESLEYFGVKIGFSEEDGVTPKLHYYPYTKDGELKAYKVRLIENKRIWSVGDQKEVDLFGWEQAIQTGAKNLIVVEGEPDAIAFYQIAKDYNKGGQYADANPAVVSLAHGAAGAAKDIARLKDKILRHFKGVILAFDMDEAGKKAVEEVMLVIPDATSATLPAKDINECLIQGRSKAAYQAVMFNSSKPKNSRIVNARDLHEVAKKQPEWGISWPWKHVTEATRGIRFGETIYLGAGQKQGKSEVVNQLVAHLIKEHKIKCFVAKPEEANAKTYKMVAGKMVGKFFHDPKKPFDMDAYDKAGEMIGDSLFMVNLYQHLGWATLKADIIEAVKTEGCKAIFIDPITNLTNGMEAAAANVKLQEIAQELSAMALDLNVVIFIFCHLRNPDNGPPHERGGQVLSSQFAGSRAMARSCNLMFGLEGNRDPDLSKEERNMRTLVLLEDREFGETGRFPLYWDDNTSLFNEV